jgi:hypothetical protein
MPLLIDRTPQPVRFATQGGEHPVEVPRATVLAPRGLHSMSEALAECIAPASDRLVCHDRLTLEE